MFNNEVTYAEAWKLPENIAASEILNKKFLNRTNCSSDCPIAWASEVLAMLEDFDQKFGIRYNESSMGGYRIQGHIFHMILVSPWKGFLSSFRHNMFGKPIYRDYSGLKVVKTPRSFKNRLKDIVDNTVDPLSYAMRAITVRHINPILNRLENRQLDISQIKEKYGSLRVYHNASGWMGEYIKAEIEVVEKKLIDKGCYNQ